MNHLPPNVPVIGQSSRLVLLDHRVLSPAGIEVRDGGVGIDGCDVHLRIVEPHKASALYFPMSRDMARGLVMALARILSIEDIHINPED